VVRAIRFIAPVETPLDWTGVTTKTWKVGGLSVIATELILFGGCFARQAACINERCLE